MYRKITEKKEIEKYQKIFFNILHNNDKTEIFKNHKIGFQGDIRKCDVFWFTKLRYWSAFRIIKNKRYWNVFGLEYPKENDNSLSIIVEINFSFCGGNTGGILAKDDETGKIIIAHNGKITITGIPNGKDIFWEHYNGKRVKINNKEKVLIGELNSSDFPTNVRDFIIEVERIKEIAKGM